MIWLDDDDDHQGLLVPDGLSREEAADLGCGSWSPDRTLAPGCRSAGHYLCLECASLSQVPENLRDPAVDYGEEHS